MTSPPSPAPDLPSPADVVAASARVADHARRTPLLTSPVLDERVGGTVLVKPECLQIGGAFKFRGALNMLAQLEPAARARGVVAWSSGNHAQGVAAAARLLGMRATIVIPRDAPAIKVQNTRRLGAEVVLYDRYTEDREAIGLAIARARGATVVPPYDHPHIMAGQGTVALEMIEQNPHGSLDALLVPCGGGGLTAGCALALAGHSPGTRLYAVEPAGFDDTRRSLSSGRREIVSGDAHTVCDALMAPSPGELTFAINRHALAGAFSVTDEQVFEAMAFAWRELKLVVEPGGAVALAALLSGQLDCRGQVIGVVLTGGNVDPALFAGMLARASA